MLGARDHRSHEFAAPADDGGAPVEALEQPLEGTRHMSEQGPTRTIGAAAQACARELQRLINRITGQAN
jgi:hypothetical protein